MSPTPVKFRLTRPGLAGELSFLRDVDNNTFLIREPGETPLLSDILDSAISEDVSLCRESSVAACRGARLMSVVGWLLSGKGKGFVLGACEGFAVKVVEGSI